MLGLTNGTLEALGGMLNLPVVAGSKKREIIVNCGGCTSLHHNG